MSNPYESPAVSPSSKMGDAPAAKIDAPIWLIVIAVLSIILASLGLIGTCIGGAHTLINLGTDAANPANPQQKLIAAQKPYLPIMLPLAAIGMILYLTLLIGAIGSFKRGNSRAYSIFKYSLFCVTVLYLVSGIVNYLIQSATLDVMIESIQAQQQNPAPFDMKPLMQAMLVVGLAVAAGFMVFTLASGLYLQKSRRVKEFLGVRR